MSEREEIPLHYYYLKTYHVRPSPLNRILIITKYATLVYVFISVVTNPDF